MKINILKIFLSFILLIFANLDIGASKVYNSLEVGGIKYSGKKIYPKDSDNKTLFNALEMYLFNATENGDTLILVSDHWKLFSTPLCFMSTTEIQNKIGDIHESERGADYFLVIPFQSNQTQQVEYDNFLKYSYGEYNHIKNKLISARITIPSIDINGIKVGDSWEYVESALEWTGLTNEHYDTILIFYPSLVSNSENDLWSIAENGCPNRFGAYNFIEFRLDENGVIREINLDTLPSPRR